MTRKLRFNYDRYGVPDHTCIALEDYFFHGYEPGSFLMAVLCNNLAGACTRCDHINSEHIVGIVTWIIHNAPSDAWGNLSLVNQWIADKGGVRTQFKDAFEKRLIWETLQE